MLIILSSICTVIFINNGFKRLKGMENKKHKSVIVNVLTFIILINGLTIYSGLVLKFQSKVDQKTNYEFITIENKKYVILSEYDDKYLITSISNNNGNYTFYTNKYKFVNMNNVTIYYKKISYPTIDKTEQ